MAKIIAKFRAENVFPSLGSIEVTKIVVFASKLLFPLKNSIFVRIIRKDSAKSPFGSFRIKECSPSASLAVL